MNDETAEIVRAGYDAMAARHLRWIGEIRGDQRLRYTADLDRRLPHGAEIVDLGCGAGVPCTALLAQRHRVLGIDISAEQIRLARELVPAARFEQRDLMSLDLPDASLDAVTAFYSLIHVPRDQHAVLLSRIYRWLRPGGLFLATFSASGVSDGVQDDFLGVPMFFSGYDADANRGLVIAAGFDIVVDEVVMMDEPDGPATFLWMLAQRDSAQRDPAQRDLAQRDPAQRDLVQRDPGTA